tara:strand:- start:134 stop:733 length:600 start_codon:yes stop_codon:yes gene_type:complete
MVLEHQRIFPTHIYIDQECNFGLRDIKKWILDHYEENAVEWQSEPNLYEVEEFKPLVDKINNNVIEIFKDFKLNTDKFEITNMWANVSKVGEGHRPHTHSNNFLSGIFYVSADLDDHNGITFTDPRPQSWVINPQREMTVDTASILTYKARTGTMYIFPAWLQHYVDINKSATNRIGISFNIMLKGLVGNKNDLQSATF